MALNINGTTGISGVDGSASAPALTGTDSNPGINFASDTVNINTGGSTRATVNSSGNVGIGTSSPSNLLTLEHSANASNGLVVKNTNNSQSSADALISIQGGDNAQSVLELECNGQKHQFVESGTGDLKIFDNASEIARFRGATGGLMINSDGSDRIGEPRLHVTQGGASTNVASFFYNTTDNRDAVLIRHNGAVVGASRKMIKFLNDQGNAAGSIESDRNSTAYITSSDYRLKENEVSISDGITRLKTLKPYRFNFKDAPAITVDGFFAHEVTAVPEAISGTKDEVDSDNKPVYQGIDQSKLVPLLTAALQEAIAKIEVLETKVAALEAG